MPYFDKNGRKKVLLISTNWSKKKKKKDVWVQEARYLGQNDLYLQEGIDLLLFLYMVVIKNQGTGMSLKCNLQNL